MERFNPGIHHRRSIRYQGYDYSHIGEYFLTLCCYDHHCLFGFVTNGKMVLNKFGMIAQEEWYKSAEIRQEIRLHEFVVMPNHIHGIVEIIGCRGDRPVAQNNVINDRMIDNKEKGDRPVAPTGPQSGSVGAMIAGYKSSVTSKINQLRNSQGKPIWQRNFYDNIIRNEESLQSIRDYIRNNPAKWSSDKFYNGKSLV
jgi:REP element-mobilizing transposase RayT